MKEKKTALLVAGILLASLSESAGPIWILAAVGSFASFAALLVICSREGAAVPKAPEGRGRMVAVASFRPPVTALHERQDELGSAPRAKPPGWRSSRKPLPASDPRQICRVP